MEKLIKTEGIMIVNDKPGKNITTEWSLEGKLADSRDLMQSIIGNTTDAIYIKDNSGKYLLIKTATEKVIGKSAAEILGKDDFYLFPVIEATSIMDQDTEIMKSCQTKTYEE